MTELARPQRAPRPPQAAAARRRPRIWPTIAAAVAAFAVLFELMAFQLSSGNDPALGSSVLANAPKAQPDLRAVLNRRIVKTRVVHSPPDPAGTASIAVAPATAPVPSSPAPVVSPAPTPVAPAPVTSSS